MNFKEWSADFEIGIGSIDGDHRNLFDTIQQLGKQIDSDGEAERIAATISSLILYVNEHFEREELFLRRAGYPDYEAHKQVHDEFRDTVLSLQKFHLEKPDRVDPVKIVSFLENWLLNHILKTDKQYAPYLIGDKKGNPEIKESAPKAAVNKTFEITCPEDKIEHVRHFIDLISHGSEEGALVDAAVEKITEVQKARRDKKALELFGK